MTVNIIIAIANKKGDIYYRNKPTYYNIGFK